MNTAAHVAVPSQHALLLSAVQRWLAADDALCAEGNTHQFVQHWNERFEAREAVRRMLAKEPNREHA